jgi:hypothetical protein
MGQHGGPAGEGLLVVEGDGRPPAGRWSGREPDLLMLRAAPDSGRQSSRAVSGELWRRRRWPVVAAAASTGIRLRLRPARWLAAAATRRPLANHPPVHPGAAANRQGLFLVLTLLEISSPPYAVVLAG